MNAIPIKTSSIFLISIFCMAVLVGCGSNTILPFTAATSTPEIPISTVSPLVTAEGHIVPRDSTRLVFVTTGDITELSAKEGDTVAKDAVLARLGNREAAEAAVAAAQFEKVNADTALKTLNDNWDMAKSAAELALAQAKIAYDKAKDHRDGMDYPRGTQTDIDNAWSTYQLALTQVATAQDTYDKARNLPDNHPLKAKAIMDLTTAQKARDQSLANYNWLTGKPTENDLAEADGKLAVAKSKLDDSQREVDKLKTGPDPDQFAVAKARIENANAQLSAAQAALDNLELKAPFAGSIIELNVSANEHILPNQPILTIADLSEMYVDTSDLTEMDVVKVSPGQKVTITPDALPDINLIGQVETISQGFTEKGGDILYKVHIKLNQTDPRLRWGMTVKVTFGK